MIKKCEWSKKYLALLLMLLIPIILSSCSMWDNPISPIDEGQTDKRLPGAWVSEDSEIKIYIGKPLSGWMNFAYFEKNETRADEYFGKMYVSKIDERSFLNVKILNPEGCETDDCYLNYLIFEYEIKGKNAMLFPPDESFVKDAIANAQISGESPDGYIVHSESEEIRDFIKRSPKEKLFPADQALLLRKFR